MSRYDRMICNDVLFVNVVTEYNYIKITFSIDDVHCSFLAMTIAMRWLYDHVKLKNEKLRVCILHDQTYS